MKKEKIRNPSEKLTLETKTLTKRQQEILDYIVEFTTEAGYPPTVRDIAKGVGLSSSSTVHFHLNALEDKGFIHRDPSKPRALKTFLNGNNSSCIDKESLESSNNSEIGKTKDSISQKEVCSFIIEEEINSKDDLKENNCNFIKNESNFEKNQQQNPKTPCKDETTEEDKEESDTDNLTPINYLGCEIAPFPIVNNTTKDNPLTDHQLEAGFLPLPLSLTKGKEGFIMSMEGDSMTGIGINHGDLCFFQITETFKDGDVSALYANGQLTVKKIYGHMGLYRLEPENRKMNPVYVKNVKVLGKLAGVIKTYL